jgi:hypothetical protein
MTALRTALAAQLARYDDDAFAALANRGLLRRATKDLEKAAATVAEESDDALVMAFGEHRVRFDVRGPAHARCSCPASGVCQHVLACAITLQRTRPSDPVEASSTPPDPLDALHASLAAIPDAQLVRHAGKAGYRWAWQFVQDLDAERGFRVTGERHLVLAFAHPRIGFRYMGGGLDALVTDAALSQPAKYRVAALLAYRRMQGLEIAPPEPTSRVTNAALDLGQDHQLDDAGGDPAQARARLRQAALQLIAECVELGLSHLSGGIAERFSTLAVWAQGADYPRLAQLLRRAADHVELLTDRAGGADEHRLLDELTLAAALVRALAAAATRGATPAHLVGRARSRYAGAGTLELIGLGAHAWRSASGFVGLTMLFWSPADQAFMSCTDARPESQRGFDPLSRYRAAGPWSGLGAPQLLAGRRVQLTGAQLNHQGRLSAAESTTAVVMPPDSASVLRASLPAITSWAALVDPQDASRLSLLGEPQPMKDWAVLEPARFGPPLFDETRQTLSWPLHDPEGRVLHAELPWAKWTQHAIARIERLGSVEAGTRLIARLLPGQRMAGPGAQEARVVEPLSLVGVDAAPGTPAIDALFFDPAADDGFAATTRAAERAPPAPVASEQPSGSTGTRLPHVLRELRQWLQSQAERGIGEGRQGAVVDALNGHGRRCADAGFTAFAAPVDVSSAALALLRANYLCLQIDRLLGGEDIEPA